MFHLPCAGAAPRLSGVEARDLATVAPEFADCRVLGARSDHIPLPPSIRLSALHRELPQIPTTVGGADPRRSSAAPSDQTSELYAVVADPGARPPPSSATGGGAGASAGPSAEGRGDGEEEEQRESDDYYEQPAVAR